MLPGPSDPRFRTGTFVVTSFSPTVPTSAWTETGDSPRGDSGGFGPKSGRTHRARRELHRRRRGGGGGTWEVPFRDLILPRTKSDRTRTPGNLGPLVRGDLHRRPRVQRGFVVVLLASPSPSTANVLSLLPSPRRRWSLPSPPFHEVPTPRIEPSHLVYHSVCKSTRAHP